jgi:hypothetical protein
MEKCLLMKNLKPMTRHEKRNPGQGQKPNLRPVGQGTCEKNYILLDFSSREFATTLTELNAIALPAIIGESSQPVNG